MADEKNKNIEQEQQAQPVEQEQEKQTNRLGPKNLCAKYGISRDDYFAVIERIVRWILNNYNFGSEIVTISFLDLIRNGDIPEEIRKEEKKGIYRR